MSKALQKFAACLGILGFCLICGCSQSESTALKDRKKAPDFKADIFYPQNRPPFQLSRVNADRPVLIVFWATWCPSCLEEIPQLNSFVSVYQGKIEIVSINAQERSEDIELFLAKNRVDFPVILDPDAKLSDLFEVSAIPSVLLLAKGGKILYYGFRLPDTEKLEAALKV